MKKYDVSLRSVMYCRVSVYANSIDEAQKEAVSRVNNNEVSYYDKEVILTDINEVPYSKKDRINQMIIQSFLKTNTTKMMLGNFLKKHFSVD